MLLALILGIQIQKQQVLQLPPTTTTTTKTTQLLTSLAIATIVTTISLLSLQQKQPPYKNQQQQKLRIKEKPRKLKRVTKSKTKKIVTLKQSF